VIPKAKSFKKIYSCYAANTLLDILQLNKDIYISNLKFQI